MKTKSTVPIIGIAILALACQKTAIQLAANSSTVSDQKKQELTISFHHPSVTNLGPDVDFFSNDEPLGGSGDKIFDDCRYTGLQKSSGTVKVSGSEWLMVIDEKRSGATISVGEPYYWIQYVDEEPHPFRYLATDLGNINWPYIKIGPFRDTLSTGTGTWKIESSSHSLITKGAGTLIYRASITYDFSEAYIQRAEEGGTLEQIGRRSVEVSTLTGEYK
ncbi:MAG TPA: hypothetical protein VN958_21960 [Chitinophagaceae bacterium]|nr:hypothetical protein [Chitinophagaceae bacterium]